MDPAEFTLHAGYIIGLLGIAFCINAALIAWFVVYVEPRIQASRKQAWVADREACDAMRQQGFSEGEIKRTMAAQGRNYFGVSNDR